MDTFEQLQAIISANLGVPTANIRPDSKASDFSKWNSVEHLLLMMEIEQKFGFKFALEEIPELDTVDKIVTAVRKRVAT